MNNLLIKYRKCLNGLAPRPIKIQVPGWAGDANKQGEAVEPQPWHCLPFIEASTYGLELYYSFEGETRISLKDGQLFFEGDYTMDYPDAPGQKMSLFSAFAPGHFGTSACLDIEVPEGYVLRTEPHPRFYTDTTNTVPCCIPGHLQTQWWPKIFFVVFKNPLPGQTLIFKQGEPYGQALIVPKKVQYDVQEMTEKEQQERSLFEQLIGQHCSKFAKHTWSYKDGAFDDKYKVLSAIFAKNGAEGVKNFLKSFS